MALLLNHSLEGQRQIHQDPISPYTSHDDAHTTVQTAGVPTERCSHAKYSQQLTLCTQCIYSVKYNPLEVKDIQDYWYECLTVEVQSNIEIKGEMLILRHISACHVSRLIPVEVSGRQTKGPKPKL